MIEVDRKTKGKILQNEAGVRFVIIEQKGDDIWRGRHKSLHEAENAGDCGIGVDRVLLQRAEKHSVTHVMVVIEDLRRIYFAPLATFFDHTKVRSRPNWRGRATQVVATTFLKHHYCGPCLQKKRKRASA